MGFLSHANTTTRLVHHCLRQNGRSTTRGLPVAAITSFHPNCASFYNNNPSLAPSFSSRIGSRASFGSTAFVSLASSSNTMKSKLGLGGNNWSRMEAEKYESVIAKGLEKGITVIEAGQEGGDQALLEALQKAQDKCTYPVTATLRIGYRTVLPKDDGENKNGEPPSSDSSTSMESFPGDVSVEQHPFLGPNRTMTPLDDEDLRTTPSNNTGDGDGQVIQILHNTSEAYIQSQLAASPLVQEYQSSSSSPIGANMSVVALLHNPEAQIMDLANEYDINEVSLENRQIFLRDRLVTAFCAMEKAVANKQITSYGIASNGLVLPPEHPLAISTETILEAVKLAMEKVGPSTKCHLSVIQLPINLMERTGLDIAKELYAKIQEDEECQHLRDSPPLEIYAMRPLTCYPDRGTGTGHAFRLVDYLLPSGPKHHDQVKEGEDGQNVTRVDDGEAQKLNEDEVSDEDLASMQWTHLMDGPPLIYSIALKKAMAHFDAEEILEEKMKRDLTSEERETLDGCKLMQSMLHDLDVGLSDVRSLGAHEQDLMQRIIPLIHDTFEGYDEETADVLGMFFKCYSLAVRYSVARNTRSLLQQGGDDGRGYKYESIPENEKLQDYALKFLLNEKAISKVIIGATKPEHVVEFTNLCYEDAAESGDGGQEKNE